MPINPYEPPREESGPPRRPRRYFAVYVALGLAGAIVGIFGTALMAAIDDVNTLPHIAFATLAPMVWYRLLGGRTNDVTNPAMRPGFLSKGRIVHSVRYTFSEGSDLSVPLTPAGDAADGSITPEDPAKRVVSLRPGDFALVGGARCEVESVTVGDWSPGRSHTAWSLEEDGRTA